MENVEKEAKAEDSGKLEACNSAAIANYTRKVTFGCGNMYLGINVGNMRPVRVFIKIGKSGCCQRALLEAVGRLLTIMLENDEPLERIARTLSGIRCDEASMGSVRTNAEGNPEACTSCMDALAKELRDFCVNNECPEPEEESKEEITQEEQKENSEV